MADIVLFFLVQSGKSNFGYIYGVGLFGSLSIYTLLNLMSQKGIDAYRTASVLGYCLLPMVAVALLSIPLQLQYVFLTSTLAVTLRRSQRIPRLRPLLPLYRMVHMVRIWHLRRGTADVRPALLGGVPCWLVIWLLRSALHLQRRYCRPWIQVDYLSSIIGALAVCGITILTHPIDLRERFRNGVSWVVVENHATLRVLKH